jgi:hypothetical protein
MINNTLRLTLYLLVMTLARVSASKSSLRGSRTLSWGINGGKKRRKKQGCNGEKCAKNVRIANKFQGIKVVLIDNINEDETTDEPTEDETTDEPTETKVETNQAENKVEKNGNSGKQIAKSEYGESAFDPATLSPEPCDGGSINCNKKRPAKPQHTHSLLSVPMCCECMKLPCDCHYESVQDSILFKMIHGSVKKNTNEQNGSSTSCTGENCKRGTSVQDDSIQGSRVTPNEEALVDGAPNPFPCTGTDASRDSSSEGTSTVTNDSPSAELMCCCDKCASFPCQCSCDYFTLSQAPSFP